MYALKVMRAHGMDDDALQVVYRSVVIARLQYPAPGGASLTRPTSSVLKHLSVAV